MRAVGKPPQSYTVAGLSIWRTKLPNVRFAVLPPMDTRPNPWATDSLLYVSVLWPGAVVALERSTGRIVWRRSIPNSGASAVYVHSGILFAKSAHTLWALRPQTGEPLWSFCPYGPRGEPLYSSPVVWRNRLFIGDRSGYLHCLNAASGKHIWWRLTNRAKNCDVNSTPLVWRGKVIAGTNAATAVAFDARSGVRLWTTKLDWPSIREVMICRGGVIVAAKSVYFLDADTGHITGRFRVAADESVVSAATTPSQTVAVIGRAAGAGREPYKLVVIDVRSGTHVTSAVPSCAWVRYASETGLFYSAHFSGIELVSPRSGVIARIEDTAGDGFGPPDVKDGILYVLCMNGVVHALRHPRAPR